MASLLEQKVPRLQVDQGVLDFLQDYLIAHRLSTLSALIWSCSLIVLALAFSLATASWRWKALARERERLAHGVVLNASRAGAGAGGYLQASWTTRLRAKWVLPRPRPRLIKGNSWLARLRVRIAAATLPRGQCILIALYLLVSLILSFAGPDAIQQEMTPLQDLKDALHPVILESDGEGLALNPPIIVDTSGSLGTNTISKAWWTVGNRTGVMAFANLPLLILLIVRTPGVNILQWISGIRTIDLNTCHRWVGRLILILSTVHVAAWSVQASRDEVLRYGLSPTDPDGIMITGQSRIIRILLLWSTFRWGMVAYAALLMLHIAAFRPCLLRPRAYEFFHALHGFLAIVFFVACWLHYPPMMGWVAVAMSIWAAERVCRTAWVFWTNRSNNEIIILQLDQSRSEKLPEPSEIGQQGSFFNLSTAANSEYSLLQKSDLSHSYPPTLEAQQMARVSGFGFEASIQALPGRTMRMIIPVGRRIPKWTAGQHIWICIPSLPSPSNSKHLSLLAAIEWHPFTIASTPSTCSAWQGEHGPASEDRLDNEQVVLIIRARNGMTNRLYDWTRKSLLRHAAHLSQQSDEGTLDSANASPKPPTPILRILLEPTVVATRSHFEHHDASLIICGGSGISFGIAVLGSLVDCLKADASALARYSPNLASEKEGRQRQNCRLSRTRQVRFVWIIQDGSHLSWVARPLQKFMTSVPEGWLTVEVFVSQSPQTQFPAVGSDTDLASRMVYETEAGRASQDFTTFEGEAYQVPPSEIDLAKYQAGHASRLSSAAGLRRDLPPIPFTPIRNGSEVTLHAVLGGHGVDHHHRPTSSIAPALLRPVLPSSTSSGSGWREFANEMGNKRGDDFVLGYHPSTDSLVSSGTHKPMKTAQNHPRTSSTNTGFLSAPAPFKNMSRVQNEYQPLGQSPFHSRTNSSQGLLPLSAPFEQLPRTQSDTIIPTASIRALPKPSKMTTSPPQAPPHGRQSPLEWHSFANASTETFVPLGWEEFHGGADASATASLLSSQRNSPQKHASPRNSAYHSGHHHHHHPRERAELFSMVAGKPDLERTFNEVLYGIRNVNDSSLGVVACGPISLDAEVRAVVAKGMLATRTKVDLVTQEFGW